ncbi:MAG: hypothetical protein IT455_22140 [Planctomycetes bacterium]|nr:hypothetical protein [Planctomycetota bacterium]
MNALETEFLVACELHDPVRLREVLDAGLDVRLPIQRRSAVDWLLSMYTRTDQLPQCVRLLIDDGAMPEDPRLVPVLLDDGDAVAEAIRDDHARLHHRTTLRSAFTPLDGAPLLHVAAEFGLRHAVDALLAAGAEVDARAGVDAFGMGGHSALFHVVNSHGNRSAPIMHRLLAAGADPLLRVDGLTWGRGMDWETTWYDLTPVGYAQLGLTPQMHRDERHVHANVRALLAAARRTMPPLQNVPNRYLRQ